MIRRFFSQSRRRLPILFGSLGVLLFMLGDAWHSGRTSHLIIYNQTDVPIPQLHVMACGQSWTYTDLADRGSIDLPLAWSGPTDFIRIDAPSLFNRPWEGACISPYGGHIVTVRLRRDGEVETHEQRSFWAQVFGGEE